MVTRVAEPGTYGAQVSYFIVIIISVTISVPSDHAAPGRTGHSTTMHESAPRANSVVSYAMPPLGSSSSWAEEGARLGHERFAKVSKQQRAQTNKHTASKRGFRAGATTSFYDRTE